MKKAGGLSLRQLGTGTLPLLPPEKEYNLVSTALVLIPLIPNTVPKRFAPPP